MNMTYEENLTFKSDKPIPVELLVDLANQLNQRGIEVYFANDSLWEDCQKLLMEKGTSYILSIRGIQEAVLPKTEDKDYRDLLIKVLSEQLQSLAPSNSLTIVDPYFFPTNLHNKDGYLSTVREIIGPIIPKIKSARFITRAEYDGALYDAISRIFTDLNPQMDISHRTTNDFHDRFWIVDETRGMFVGTSLNGLGKKYALTDFIRNEDTVIIVEELRKAKLL